MHNIFSLDRNIKYKEHILIANDLPIGIVNPGIMFTNVISSNQTNSVKVIGPKGTVVVSEALDKDTLAGLIATRALLLGNVQAIKQVNDYLNHYRTSRTASYLCSIASNCDDIIQAFERWSKIRIGIIGCGGIGSLSALLLAGSGINNLFLIDSDIIEKSNLNRQFFWTKNDIGKRKIDVLSMCLHQRFDNMNIDKMPLKVDVQNLEKIIDKADAFLFTADEPVGIVQHARMIAKSRNKILISAGYLLNEIIVSSDLNINLKEKLKIKTLSNSIMPSFGPVNAEAAGVASTLLLLKVAGLTNNSEEYFNWKSHEWSRKAQ